MERFFIPLERYEHFEQDLNSLGIEYIINENIKKDHQDEVNATVRYQNRTYQLGLYPNRKMGTMDGTVDMLSEESLQNDEDFLNTFLKVVTKQDSKVYIDPRVRDDDFSMRYFEVISFLIRYGIRFFALIGIYASVRYITG